MGEKEQSLKKDKLSQITEGAENSQNEDDNISLDPQSQKNKASKSDNNVKTTDKKLTSLLTEKMTQKQQLNLMKDIQNDSNLEKKEDLVKKKTKVLYDKKVDFSEHKKIKLGGYELYFPYTPYDVQSDYMHKVLMAVKDGENALLESPTGTGKTLCLLTAAIAALKQERDKEDGKVWDR